MASGHVSRAVAAWQDRLLTLMAAAEAELNFSDEDAVDDYDDAAQRLVTGMALLAADLGEWLARPAAEVIADGLSVVIAGPRSEEHTSELQSLLRLSYAV